MQLYALGEKERVIRAAAARRGVDYRCLECGNLVHLRQGPHRQPHFYHLSTPTQCRQHGKSEEHLEVQRFIERSIGKGRSKLEHRFSEIDRIADVVWEERRLVFEVQCSPITAAEVKERCRDYASLGYEVVWIFHQRQFNRRRVSAAEMVVRHHPYYFTDMDATGRGGIYSQYDRVVEGWRSERFNPLAVDVSQPSYYKDNRSHVLLSQRSSSLYFAGDLIDLALHHPTAPYLQHAMTLEAAAMPIKEAWWERGWRRYVVHPYLCLFQAVLEKVCR